MSARVMPTRTSQQELDELVLATLPAQGAWQEAEYLWLTDRSNHLVEFTDGYVEVLPMPTEKHQAILRFLFLNFLPHIQRRGGKLFVAPLRFRLRERVYREPDLLLLLDASDPRRRDRYWLGADLVVEVVSPDDPARDLVQKRRDYATVGIPEYWIVNPLDETITVLTLRGDSYTTHGVFRRGDRATSVVLPGFAVDVSADFDAE